MEPLLAIPLLAKGMSAQRAERHRLLEAHAVAARFYRARLASAEGASPSGFLARRGVPLDGPWLVGYAPDRSAALVTELRRRGFNDVEIRASGLAATGRTGRLVDRFQNRVVIGVRDSSAPDAPVVGFVGYAPPSAGPEVPARLYSPATAIFRPGEVLFGLAEQRERTGGHSVLAGDPLDAIAIATRAGRDGPPPLAVASAGPRLTRTQVAALSEVADVDAGIGVAVGNDRLQRRDAERAYRLLASILPSDNLEAVDVGGDPRAVRPLMQALGASDSARIAGRSTRARDPAASGSNAPRTVREVEQLAFDFDALSTLPEVRRGLQAPRPRGHLKAAEAPARGAPEPPAVHSDRQQDLGGRTGDAGESQPPQPPVRPRATAPDVIAPADPKARAKANLAALRTLATLTAEERPATADERLVLGRWVSWGAVPQLFDDRRAEWQAEREELLSLVGEDGYAAARRTTINAHYTDPAYAREIWRTLERLGFQDGRVLEPGCGAGIFIGTAPAGAELTGVELDPATGGIARALYRHATVRTESFAKSPFPNDHFDAVVGNVPFARESIYDPRHNKSEHSLHNHFIIKSLALTRPGGIVAVLTSRFTLDAQDASAREEMSAMADLVGAVRLPTGAHRRVAGTEVVTDLLVLRRREPDRAPASTDWLEAHPREVDGEQASINAYFDAHPDHMLGELAVGRGQYSNKTLLVRGDLATVNEALSAALDDIAKAAERDELTLTPRPVEQAPEGPSADELANAPKANPDLWNGHLTAHTRGRFTVVAQGRHLPYVVPKTQATQLAALLGLRDTAKRLLDAEAETREDTSEMGALRADLRDRYAGYVSRYGPINSFTLRRTGRTDPKTGEERYARVSPPVMKHLDTDPSAPLVKALEIFDDTTQTATPAPIMSKRVVVNREPVRRVEDPADAVHVSMERHGRVDLDTVAELLGVDSAEARSALGELVFEDPADRRLVPAAEYLSGNVREKLDRARAAAQERPELEANVRALENVLPADLGADDVAPRLGAVWIDVETHQQFFRELLGDSRLTVKHPTEGTWKLEGNTVSVAARSDWGIESMHALAIAEATLDQRPIQVMHKTKEGGRVVDPEATAGAQDKAAAMHERFEEWLWEDPERTARLLAEYNRRFNGLVLRDYAADGERLTLPGLAETFTPRPHQSTAVARMLAEPAVGLFHEVGAGKTAEMVMGAMELKRLGLIAKPCVVVPNHMLEQFSREWLQLYPRARLLAASSDDLLERKRRAFVARVATNDWDAVIMTRTGFERLPLSAEAQARYMDRALAELRHDYERGLREHTSDSSVVKKLEKRMMTAEARLAKRMDVIRDYGVSFEQTGIDYLVVDEAHDYKNLRTETKIPDAAIEGSGRATDLHLKLSYLRDRHGERVATLATATPIANSVTEAHVMMRYLCPDALDAAGVGGFDSWAATFAETAVGLEVKPTGGYRMKGRFAKFKNVPEQLRMLHVVADVKTAEDLELDVPQLAPREDGQRLPQTVVIPRSPEIAAYMEELAERASNLRGFRRKGEDNMGVISTNGRQAAVDVRLVGSVPSSSSESKLEAAARNIAQIWHDHKDRTYLDPATGQPSPTPGALQFVFCDMGTPSTEWNAYDELRDLLAEHGVPRGSVRFMHEAKNDIDKGRLFAAARSGEVAVLIGSTQKMGVGVNAQARAVALHHIDCPWRPADVAQREGRILRQGNQNAEVRVLRYVVEGSFDAYTWQTVERKARFINQIMRGRFDVREIEDVGDGALSYAEVKALASGDPLLLEKAEADAELTRLERLSRGHARNVRSLQWAIKDGQHLIERYGGDLARVREALARRTETRGDAFAMTVDGRRVVERAGAAELLQAWAADKLPSAMVRLHSEHQVELGQLGELGGQAIDASVRRGLEGKDEFVLSLRELPIEAVRVPANEADQRSVGILRQLENRVAGLPALETRLDNAREHAKAQLAERQEAVKRPFKHAEALAAAHARVAEINAQLQREASESAARDPLGPLRGVLGEAVCAEIEARATAVSQAEAGRDEAWWRAQQQEAARGLEDLRVAAAEAQRLQRGLSAAEQTAPEKVERLRAEAQAFRASGRHPEEWVKQNADQLARWVAAARGSAPEAARTASASPPVVPGTVAEGLPAQLQPARGAIAELEAAALTDLRLMDAVRVNDKDNVAPIVGEWIDDYVVTKAKGDESYDFAALQQEVGGPLNDYIVDRVLTARDLGTATEVASATPYRDLLGDARSRWIQDRAAAIASEAGGRDTAWWRAEHERTSGAFDELNPAAARETLTVERDKRIALEAAWEAGALVAEYEAREGSAPVRELAEVQRATLASEQRRLAGVIEREWELFDNDRHLSRWMRQAGEQAAHLVAAERELETGRQADPARPTGVARAAPDVGVGIA